MLNPSKNLFLLQSFFLEHLLSKVGIGDPVILCVLSSLSLEYEVVEGFPNP